MLNALRIHKFIRNATALVRQVSFGYMSCKVPIPNQYSLPHYTK